MVPLNVESFNSRTKTWEHVYLVKPQTVTKPLQNFLPNGRCELYFLECSANNTISTVKKTEIGAKVTPKGEITAYDADALTLHRTLRRGQSVEIKIKESLRRRPVSIRLTQV